MRYIKANLFILMYAYMCSNAWGQVYTGNYSTENTINVVRDNPAFVLTEDRAQINFLSADIAAGGNYLLFNRSIFSFLFDGKATPGNDYIRNTANAERMMWMNTEIAGPGASFKVLKKYSFAVTTGLRYLINSDNLNNAVFMSIGNTTTPSTTVRDTLNINNYSFTSQMFRELNVSYAMYLHNTEDFGLVAGATVRLLLGVGAMAVGIPKATYSSINNDGMAYNLTGNANFVFTPFANKFALNNNGFNAFGNATNNPGIGLDLGLIYYIHINNTMQVKRGYQLRLAASITDIGGVSYSASSTSGGYSINGKNINYRNIQNNPQETFGNRIINEYLIDTVVKGTSNVSKFWIGLPTACHFNADVNVLEERFYINGNLLVNLVSPSADNFSNHYITAFTLTPRYLLDKEKGIGFAMPFSYNALSQGSLGAVAFVGSFYVGSGSLFNMFIANTFKNANLYLGCTLRIKPKKQKEKDYMMM